MSLYFRIMEGAYIFCAIGLSAGTLALIVDSMAKRKDSFVLAKQLVAVVAGAAGSGLVLWPTQGFLSMALRGYSSVDGQALLICFLLPLALGLAVGKVAVRLLRERSDRSIRALCLLNSFFVVYACISVAAVEAVIESQSHLRALTGERLSRFVELSTNFETQMSDVQGAANQIAAILDETSKLPTNTDSTVASILNKIHQIETDRPKFPDCTDRFLICGPDGYIDSLEALHSRLERDIKSIKSEAAVREAAASLRSQAEVAVLKAREIEEVMSGAQESIGTTAQSSLAVAALSITPNLVLLVVAFLTIALSADEARRTQ